jgi:hypothetical protein
MVTFTSSLVCEDRRTYFLFKIKFNMKAKYVITLYHLGRKSDKIKCRRSLVSTIKYAIKHLLRGNCIYFTIKHL